jgi:hypothetical protein
MQQSLQAKNRGLEVRLKTAEERARDAQLGEIQMNRPPPPSGPVMKSKFHPTLTPQTALHGNFKSRGGPIHQDYLFWVQLGLTFC